MFHWVKAVVLALLLCGAQAVTTPTNSKYVLKGEYFPINYRLTFFYNIHVLSTELFDPPKEWLKHDRAPSEHKMTLRISLSQPKFSELEGHLYAVSDPESPRYGQHLSKQQVEELSAPSTEGLEAVNDWLSSHGFDINKLHRSPSLDWVKVETTVQKAEEMLDTVS